LRYCLSVISVFQARVYVFGESYIKNHICCPSMLGSSSCTLFRTPIITLGVGSDNTYALGVRRGVAPGETGTLVAIGSGSLYRETVGREFFSTGWDTTKSVAERFDGS
jgi:hypothetical protein